MNIRTHFRTVLAAVALLQGLAATHAATLYWDADANPANNNVDGTNLGGAGTWSTANSWWNGVDANQNWADSNDAVFAGTAGVVKLGAVVTAGKLTFGVTGYTIDLNKADNSTAYNLTLTGLSGQTATIRNSNSLPTPAAATLTLTMAEDTVWGGIINPDNDRLSVTVQGGKSLTVGQCRRNGGHSQHTLNVTGAGTKLVLGGTTSSWGGNYVAVQAGATLDVGNNATSARRWTLAPGGSITTTGTSGSIRQDSQYNSASYYGSLAGPLLVVFAHNGAAGEVSPITGTANSFTGGTVLSSGNAGTCDVRAQSDVALGTGRVRMENNLAGNTSILDFTSPAPSIGSLESAGVGTKRVLLGTSVAATSVGLKATYAQNNVLLTLTAGSTTSLTVGQPITGASIPGGTVVTAIRNGTQFTISQNPSANQTDVAVSASLMKATWANSSTAFTLTAGSTLGLSVGQTITGTGIPAGSVVTAITGSTTFTISQTTTAAGTGATIGASAVDTTLSVGALNWASDSFGGEIGQAFGTVGSVTKVGTGTWTLGGVNKYTGTTRVENGTLALVKKGGFASGTLKYTSVNGSAVITITTGSASQLTPGQYVTGPNIPVNALVSSIAGNLVTLTAVTTANGSNLNLQAYAMDGSLASGDIDVVGGTLNGSGTIGFRLDGATDGIVMTSGALDLSNLAINFTGAATLTSYTVVDYSAGSTLTTATGVPATADTFASAANVPEGYKWLHDTSAKRVLLFLPPAGTIILLR